MSGLWKIITGLLAALGLLVALAGGVFAQEPSPGELMARANAHYDREEYSEAIQQYEALIGRGYRDAAVHYNLGNTYLENGDLGRAILNYRRAEELSPRDPEILANLQLARSRTVDQLEAEGASLVASISDFGRRWATTGEFGLAALMLWAVGAVTVGALILRPNIQRRNILRNGAVVCFAVMLICLVLLLSMLYSNPYKNTGVVTEGIVEVLSGPGQQYEEVFTLHSGAQVRLVDSHHGWLQVALPGGELRGWAPAHALLPVRGDGGW